MDSLISDLLHYKNSSVVTQFCHHHAQYSLQEGEQLFQDFLAWLWLKNERKKQNKVTYLFGPLLILDELWHVFILHTRDYTDFTLKYFGEYIHHQPEPIGFEHFLNEEELKDYLTDCFLYLDPQWVERCFASALDDEDGSPLFDMVP
jgi:hypothetical protein